MDDLTRCAKPSLKKAEPAKPSMKKALPELIPVLTTGKDAEPEKEKPEDIVPGLIVLEAKQFKFALKKEAKKLLAADLEAIKDIKNVPKINGAEDLKVEPKLDAVEDIKDSPEVDAVEDIKDAPKVDKP